jgi:quercetin dioxygenase-like cupin family protein
MSEDHATSGSSLRPARSVSGQGLTFQLGEQIAALRDELGRTSGGRAAKTLGKAGSLRVTLVVLAPQTTIEPQAAAGGASLQVLEGSVRLRVEGQERVVRRGDLVVLEENLNEPLRAEESSAVLLTVAWPEGAGAWEQEAASGRL